MVWGQGALEFQSSDDSFTGEMAGFNTFLLPVPAMKAEVGVQNSAGWQVSAEWYPVPGIGIEASYFAFSKALTANVTVDDDINLPVDDGSTLVTAETNLGASAVYIGANFHFAPEKRLDYYLGAGIPFVNIEDIPQGESDIGKVNVSWGFSSGARYLVNDRVCLVGGLRYYDTGEVNFGDQSGRFKFLVISVGAGLRF